MLKIELPELSKEVVRVMRRRVCVAVIWKRVAIAEMEEVDLTSAELRQIADEMDRLALVAANESH